jgi:hypothetical protein
VAIRWVGLALLGILIAAAVSIAASRLASQQIGLSSQPITAGDALAPRPREGAVNRRSRPSRRSSPAAPQTRSAPPPPAPEPVEVEPPSAPEPLEPAPAPAPAPREGPGDSGGGDSGGDD